jgi:uncharacterized protein (TIGR03437 family)
VQSEPAVSSAVSFTNSSYITLDGCIVSQTAGWGVEFEGAGPYTTTPVNQVLNSALYDLGTGGIRIGNVAHPGDTKAGVAQYGVVQNTVVAGGGRFLPAGVGTGIFIGNSHNNTVTHNDIFDFYSGAIGVCVPTPATCPLPHDNLIAFNHVYQLGQGVTSDFGGIYVATYTAAGNKIMNNKVHDLTHDYQDPDGYGGEGIYLDNLTSNVLVQNNLVYRASQSTLFNNQGANNTIANNIFAYGRLAMVQRGTDTRDLLSFNFNNNIVYFTVSPIQKQPGEWDCTDNSNMAVPCTGRFFFDSNLYWNPAGTPPSFVTGNVPPHVVNYSFPQWQALGEDVHSQNQDPLFVNPGYPADDFRLQAASPAGKIGFVPFDATQAGRTAPVLMAPTLPPAFPLQLLDPVKDYGAAMSKAATASSVSAASYTAPLASEAIASALGADLANATQPAASVPLPMSIAGTQVAVRDSTGTERLAPLFFVSPGQVNYEVPAQTANGPATLTITSGDGAVSTGVIDVSTVAPGLFTANASGQGVAAALAVRATADGQQTMVPVFQCSGGAGTCVSTPIDLGAATDVVALELFGTGIRGRSLLSNVSCTVGGVTANVAYAGAQGGYVGLDQVNVSLPRSLAGRGEMDVNLVVDGHAANTVKINVK